MRTSASWPDDLGALQGDAVGTARRVALGRVDTGALLQVLHAMPDHARTTVARSLGLPPGAPPTFGMAAALSASLSGQASVQVAGVVFRPLRQVFYCPDVSQDQWVTLLSGEREPTLVILEGGPHLAWHLWLCQQNLPPVLFSPALAVTTFTAPGQHVPAVAFLAAQDPALAEAYDKARRTHPELPKPKAAFVDLLPRTLAATATKKKERARVERIVEQAKAYHQNHAVAEE